MKSEQKRKKEKKSLPRVRKWNSDQLWMIHSDKDLKNDGRETVIHLCDKSTSLIDVCCT